MTSESLILLGAGGHARACIDVIEQTGRFRIAGLIGTIAELGAEHLGYRVIATDESLAELRKVYRQALVTVGQIQSPQSRERLYQRALELGFELPAIVARDAYVSPSARIGDGTIVMHGAIVNAGAVVGQNCIVNSRALIEHDVTVHDHSHISTGAILNGGVRIGAGCFIGSASVVKQGITIGPRCLVGMGCSVRRDQPENTRFTGATGDG